MNKLIGMTLHYENGESREVQFNQHVFFEAYFPVSDRVVTTPNGWQSIQHTGDEIYILRAGPKSVVEELERWTEPIMKNFK